MQIPISVRIQAHLAGKLLAMRAYYPIYLLLWEGLQQVL